MNRNNRLLHRFGAVLVFCFIAVQLAGFAAAAPPPPYLSTGFPQVVVVSGTDHEMGVQYGEQTAPAIVHNVAIFKSRCYDGHGRDKVTKDMQVWNYYLEKYDPAYKDWLQGIMEGCKNKGYNVEYFDLIMLMVYPTELWARPKAPYPAETNIVASTQVSPAPPALGSYHGCNTFAAKGSMTKDGKPIHAITSMVATEAMDNIIFLAFPKNGASFVSQTYAGRLNSNYAMNSKGLTWTMTAIMSDDPAWGMSPEFYFHYLAQYAASPAEALAYIDSTPRGGVTGGFILTDGSGEITVYEGTAKNFHMRRSGDRGETGPYVIQTNHLVDPSLSSYNPKWLPVIGTYARYDTVFQYLKEAAPGSIDFAFTKNLLASDDWFDVGKNTWNKNQPGGKEISDNHSSVSQAIFFPADLIAYLQTGTPGGIGLPTSATGEYVKVKLATDPKTVTYSADKDAIALYWDAADSFRHDQNANAAYVSTTAGGEIREELDQAFAAYSVGMDRASFANLSSDPKEQISLWAEAMTYYAKSQLFSQIAKTQLLKARAGSR
ncbi:MAG: C45 family peptidase [Syntrophorhabdales bacterium]